MFYVLLDSTDMISRTVYRLKAKRGMVLMLLLARILGIVKNTKMTIHPRRALVLEISYLQTSECVWRRNLLRNVGKTHVLFLTTVKHDVYTH